MGHLRLIGTFLRLGLLNELQYRANFFSSILEAAISLSVSLGGLGLIYRHTDSLAGWGASELLVLLGIYYIMGGFIQTFVQPSMEQLLRDVRNGTLDFTLTKPVDAQMLVSIRSFAVWKLVNVLLGAAILSVALVQVGRAVGPAQAAAFVLTLFCGAVIVYSFWLMLATVAFWFIRIDNILVIFQTMYEAGRWPVGIYPPVLRLLLTFLVPVAFAVTVPAEALTGRATPLTLVGAVLLAAAIFGAARWFWGFGVRNYSGASA